MATWRSAVTERGRRRAPVRRRALRAAAFTWTDLRHSELTAAQVDVRCFPSCFDLPVDIAAGADEEHRSRFGTRPTPHSALPARSVSRTGPRR